MTSHKLTEKLNLCFSNNKFYLVVCRNDGLVAEENEIPIYLYQALLNWYNVLNNVKTTEELIADNQFLQAKLQVSESTTTHLKDEYNYSYQASAIKTNTINKVIDLIRTHSIEGLFVSIFPELIKVEDDDDNDEDYNSDFNE